MRAFEGAQGLAVAFWIITVPVCSTLGRLAAMSEAEEDAMLTSVVVAVSAATKAQRPEKMMVAARMFAVVLIC